MKDAFGARPADRRDRVVGPRGRVAASASEEVGLHSELKCSWYVMKSLKVQQQPCLQCDQGNPVSCLLNTFPSPSCRHDRSFISRGGHDRGRLLAKLRVSCSPKNSSSPDHQVGLGWSRTYPLTEKPLLSKPSKPFHLHAGRASRTPSYKPCQVGHPYPQRPARIRSRRPQESHRP